MHFASEFRHHDETYAKGTRFGGIIAHGLLGAGLISAVLGTILPGIGTIWVKQDLRFKAPVYPGNTLTAVVTITGKHEHNHVTIDCRVSNQDGKTVIEGVGEILAPKERITWDEEELPDRREYSLPQSALEPLAATY